MKRLKHLTWMTVVLTVTFFCARGVLAEEKGDTHPWNLSLTIGKVDTEGDEVVNDAYAGTVMMGYNLSECWTIEGSLMLIPSLEGNYYNDYSSGSPVLVNRLKSATGATETWAVGGAVDVLYHLQPWKRFDPFLAAGYHAIKYGEKFGENDGLDINPRAGAGIMYHFNDEWAVRADFRYFLSGNVTRKSNSNGKFEVGVNWTIGAGVPARYRVSGDLNDQDGDKLTDLEEAGLGTRPDNPDTDGDFLTDYEEVRIYGTDPLNPDTDFDMLKDGTEVKNHGTNPLMQDTDKGGVSDGHEVLEDHTNPKDPKDDLLLVELNITFDYDKTIIRPEFFPKLEIIGKVMTRDPEATAKVEGHADKLKKSRAEYNQTLSEQRAAEVVEYLVKSYKIDPKRLSSAGYGFTRPKAKNDPVNGNPVNRRVEVYIKLSPKSDRAIVAPEIPIGTVVVPMPPT